MKSSSRLNITYFLLILCTLLFSGCQDEREVAFARLVPVKKANQEIGLSIANNPDNLRIGSDIDLFLENHSNDYISLPSNYGVKLYIFSVERKEWVQLENQISYYPEEARILAPADDLAHSRRIFGVRPIIPNDIKEADLRILVVGTILMNSAPTDQQVAAFVGIKLKP